MIPLERERSLAEAGRIIEEFVRARGWSVQVESTEAERADRAGGEDVLADAAPQAQICWLFDAAGDAIASGYGKGAREAARVGALYEAVEHAYANAQSPDECPMALPAAALGADPRFGALPFLAELRRQGERRMSCRTYRSFLREGERFAVPLFLTCPGALETLAADDDFDYSSVIRYGSNSGVAIGASFEEAALHAIGELVERDSWSLFLAAHYLGDPGRFGAWIEPDSLPAEAARMLDLAQRRLGREVWLVEITSDLGVPVFLAVAAELADGEAVHPSGYGASLYAEHAALRALTELVQSVLVAERMPSVRDYSEQAMRALAEYPKLQACAYLKVERERLRRRRWAHGARAPRPPAQLLRELVAALDERGVEVGYAINHRQGDAFCVVSCVAPALERFLLVSTGMVMAPGRRAMALLAPMPAGRAEVA